jgi:hypothetical protein
MRAQESFALFQAATENPTPTFQLQGGRYLVMAIGTGTILFRTQEPDNLLNGRTMKDIHGATMSSGGANILWTVDCGAGQYDFLLNSGTNTWASIVRIPLEE